jgi:hypothetical protein
VRDVGGTRTLSVRDSDGVRASVELPASVPTMTALAAAPFASSRSMASLPSSTTTMNSAVVPPFTQNASGSTKTLSSRKKSAPPGLAVALSRGERLRRHDHRHDLDLPADASQRLVRFQ